jgi:hypothetical protein
MKISREKYNSTDISGNYAEFAKALGGYGERVTEPDADHPRADQARHQEGRPVLLEPPGRQGGRRCSSSSRRRTRCYSTFRCRRLQGGTVDLLRYDSVTLCQQLQPLSPLFVEDPLRTMDDLTLYAQLRQKVGVPLAAGEQFGDLRDGNLPLVEQGLIDFLRTSIPNCGGVTSFRKLMALCEAHSVAMVPHFTPPIATAAVVHALFAFPGQAMDEVYRPALPPYLNEAYRFRDGRMAASDRPGLGVVVDESRLRQVAEFTEARPPSLYQGESIQRPDGSHLYL